MVDLITYQVVLPAVAACVFILAPKLDWSQTTVTMFSPFAVVVFKNLGFFFTILFLSPFDTKKDCPGIYL